jgi:HAD superfamily hydrolase (TIGR01509 family)
MIQAILFDFNGVIIDDERIQMKAYQEVFAEKDVELTEEGYFDCLGMSDAVFVKTIFERAGKATTDEEINELMAAKTVKWKQTVDKSMPVFEGVEDFIKRMSKGFSLGLVSMACREEIDHVLNARGLGKYFETIVSSEDVSTTKPDPECYRKGFANIDAAAIKNGHNPMTRRQCVVIEDSPAGVISAKSARLKALGVTNTVDAARLREAGADAVTNDLSDWNSATFQGLF